MSLPLDSAFPQSGSIVSRWKLDETSGTRYDSVGSNDLTDNNTVLYSATPQFSTNAADFERTNSESLSISDGSQSGLDITGDFTFSSWLKVENAPSSGQYYEIISKWLGSTSNKSFDLSYHNNAGTPEFALYISSNGSSNSLGKVSYTLTSGIWYFFSCVYDASAGSVTFYINGASIGSATGMATSIYNSTTAFYIGGEATLSNFFDGLIQDAVISTAALSGSESQDLYNAYFDLPALTDLPQNGSITSRWSLNEDGGARYDSVGSNHLTDNNTVLSGTGISEINASSERAADFESTNSEYLSITDGSQSGLDITGDLSFGCWVNFESGAGSTYMVLMSKFELTSGQRSYIIRLSASNQIEFFGSSNGSSTNLYCLVPWTPSNATRYHVGISYDASAGSCKFFIDGAQQGSTQTGLPTSIYNGSAPFALGKGSGGYYLDGLMQDPIIWNAALSTTEFSDYYDAYTAVPNTFIPRTIFF